MIEELVSFGTAKLAKEKGFDLYCYNYWIDENIQTDEHYKGKLIKELKDKCVSAPTQALLQKWLREVYEIDIIPHRTRPYDIVGRKHIKKYTCLFDGDNEGLIHLMNKVWGNTYEEALEKGLQEGLKLINYENK